MEDHKKVGEFPSKRFCVECPVCAQLTAIVTAAAVFQLLRRDTNPGKLRNYLREVRRIGFAVDNGEFFEEMVSIAVPICAANGRPLMTLSFHVPNLRMDIDGARTRLPVLFNAAHDLAELYGCEFSGTLWKQTTVIGDAWRAAQYE